MLSYVYNATYTLTNDLFHFWALCIGVVGRPRETRSWTLKGRARSSGRYISAQKCEGSILAKKRIAGWRFNLWRSSFWGQHRILSSCCSIAFRSVYSWICLHKLVANLQVLLKYAGLTGKASDQPLTLVQSSVQSLSPEPPLVLAVVSLLGIFFFHQDCIFGQTFRNLQCFPGMLPLQT